MDQVTIRAPRNLSCPTITYPDRIEDHLARPHSNTNLTTMTVSSSIWTTRARATSHILKDLVLSPVAPHQRLWTKGVLNTIQIITKLVWNHPTRTILTRILWEEAINSATKKALELEPCPAWVEQPKVAVGSQSSNMILLACNGLTTIRIAAAVHRACQSKEAALRRARPRVTTCSSSKCSNRRILRIKWWQIIHEVTTVLTWNSWCHQILWA